MTRNVSVRGVTGGPGSIGRMRLTTSALHADLPSLASETYLNTGGCGPLTRAAADALAGWAADAMAGGRGSLAGFGRTEAASVALAVTNPWTTERIEQDLRDLCERLELKPRQALQPIRVAVTGSTISPGLFESIELLGRGETLERLQAAVPIAR